MQNLLSVFENHKTFYSILVGCIIVSLFFWYGNMKQRRSKTTIVSTKVLRKSKLSHSVCVEPDEDPSDPACDYAIYVLVDGKEKEIIVDRAIYRRTVPQQVIRIKTTTYGRYDAPELTLA